MGKMGVGVVVAAATVFIPVFFFFSVRDRRMDGARCTRLLYLGGARFDRC